jgi:transposase
MLRASEQDREDIKQARQEWKAAQGRLEGHRLVFIDESAAKTTMTRLHGRCPRSERLHASAPHGHWCTTTMISSLRSDGSTACMTIDGAANTEVFAAYVKEILCPTLRPGDPVILDNLRAHKNERTLALLEQTGARVRFLPACSPDLNPIELMGSKVKALLRAAQARTAEGLLEAIGKALAAVSAQDAQPWFAHCGYTFI